MPTVSSVAPPARILLTPGEPAGIGPDLCLALARHSVPGALVAVADPNLLRQRCQQLRLDVELVDYDPDGPPNAHRPGRLPVLPIRLARETQCGRLDPANADYVLEGLRRAVKECLEGRADALVTGPVHKGVINEAGIAFSGHTEFLAELCGGAAPVMMLATPGLRVALATTHLPLHRVSDAITEQGLDVTLRVLEDDLRRRFGIERPRIRVCGLNPHAGESGHLGREEIDVIQPVLDRLRAEGMALEGPVPADTAFVPERLAETDVVLAMYHDQGLPVLKHLGFGRAVNITLGLPIIRTSVDHGTALELAGTGTADPGSLMAAVETAIDMVAEQQRTSAARR